MALAPLTCSLSGHWLSPRRYLERQETRSQRPVLAAARCGGEVASLDSASCTPCEGQFLLPSTSIGASVLAGRVRGGQPAEQALVAWGYSPNTINIVAFRAADGIVTDLGGGCGQGGEALVSCARVGNVYFTQELRGAASSSPCWLLFGAGPFQFPCGPCSLVVNPACAVVAFAGSTDANGRASAALPLPNVPGLIGLKFREQWLLAASGGCAQFGIAFSNGIEVELQ